MSFLQSQRLSRRKWMAIAGCAGLCGLVPQAKAGGKQSGSTFQQHRSTKRGFYSNAYIFEGDQDCVLIDAHLNPEEARELTELISAIDKPLVSIIITHPHPDHFLGLEYIAPLAPKAIIWSSEKTLKFIRTAASDWSGFSSSLQALSEGPMTFAGHEFQCLLPADAESVAPVVLFERQSGTLVAGDHVLNGQHLWLVEGRGKAWLNNLQLIADRWPVTTVLPGHGLVGGPGLISSTAAYLDDFLRLKDSRATADLARQEMLERYPGHVFTEALDNSIQANF